MNWADILWVCSLRYLIVPYLLSFCVTARKVGVEHLYPLSNFRVVPLTNLKIHMTRKFHTSVSGELDAPYFLLAKLTYIWPLSVSPSVTKIKKILWTQLLLNGWMDWAEIFKKFFLRCLLDGLSREFSLGCLVVHLTKIFNVCQWLSQ